MKSIVLWLLGVAAYLPVFSQHTVHAVIKNKETNEPLSGATVVLYEKAKSVTSDRYGRISIGDIPNGKQIIQYRFIGFQTRIDTLEFPLATSDTLLILMETEVDEMDEVVISSTRSSRTINDIPTRIEFIAGEELEEKANMKAGDIRMVLSESTGIQVQQTSATSANASIRIQGLDGRYTQILKDGFPVFAGAASGLGLLQTPPLDLKQVEVIKGSASTLYGGGAIAGLVNLISKTPTEEREIRFHLNGTTGGGIDLNGFYGQRFKKTGTTIFASYNRNRAFDPAQIDLTAIPKFDRFVLNPKLFLYLTEKTKLIVGINAAFENRIGGDVHFIEGKGDSTHRYFEENKTKRFSTQFSLEHLLSEKSKLSFKNSVSYFNRSIQIPEYLFKGTQVATFSEATYNHTGEKSEWITGLNAWTDHFTEQKTDSFPLRSYNQVVLGAFVQNTWKATNWLQVETGIRTDYVYDYGFTFLPRVSALFKITDKLTSRLGSGLGYKAPTIFTEESERIQYRNVLPINDNINKLEKSYGVNLDFNYRTTVFNKITLSINQLFFYTNVNNPLLLELQSNNAFRFVNSSGRIDSKGAETNIKIGYEDFKLFVGYTYTDAKLHKNGISTENPLTPKHRINSVLMYEKEDAWKIGLESYYFSRQTLSDGASGKQYVLCGFMAEKLWERFSVYINFENFLDARQTRFDTIYTGSITNPVFRDIYAPLDGFIINAGIKIKL